MGVMQVVVDEFWWWVGRSGEAGSAIAPPDVPIDDDDEGPGGGGGAWTTIATFWSNVEAHLAQAALEREDIDSVLLDEHTVAALGWYVGAVGGIKLQVRAEQAQVARAILRPMMNQRAAGPACCPRCGGAELVPVPRGAVVETLDRLSWGLISRLFGRPVRCASCEGVSRVH